MTVWNNGAIFFHAEDFFVERKMLWQTIQLGKYDGLRVHAQIGKLENPSQFFEVNKAQQFGQFDLIEQRLDALLPLHERERLAAQIQTHIVQIFGPMLRERTNRLGKKLVREKRFEQKVAANRSETLFDKFAARRRRRYGLFHIYAHYEFVCNFTLNVIIRRTQRASRLNIF